MESIWKEQHWNIWGANPTCAVKDGEKLQVIEDSKWDTTGAAPAYGRRPITVHRYVQNLVNLLTGR